MDKILEKFGNSKYIANETTLKVGINYLLAERISERFRGLTRIIDTCCGAGFMSIVLAKVVSNIVAVDLNKEHLELAIQNSKVAGVNDKIKFIEGDVLEVNLEGLGIDGAFLDPDWADTNEKHIHASCLSKMTPPGDKLFGKIFKTTENIALRLPKEFDLDEIKKFPPHEIERVYLNDDFKFYCIYFGKLIKELGNTELKVVRHSKV